jgi:hypothetical protein
MSNNIDFKDLWQKKISEPPALSELVNLASKLKRQLLIKTVLLNIVLILTAAIIIGIWIYYQPQLISTKIGICLVIFAIFSFVFVQSRILPYLKNEKEILSLNEYLIQLKKLRQKELFIQTTMMNIYFILLAFGVFLYMYEYVPKTVLSISLTYGITLAWFSLNWFYIRPKGIKKQQEKTNSLIAKFEILQKQISEQ